jgi:hypothetical protein
MFSWFKPKEETLKPLPLSQREKSYSAETGLVYQYIFKGLRGKRHVFAVTADRKTSIEVVIEMPEAALAACACRMGSPLRWNEEYALAKLCLFAAFDEAASAEELKKTVVASEAALLAHMDTLNMG